VSRCWSLRFRRRFRPGERKGHGRRQARGRDRECSEVSRNRAGVSRIETTPKINLKKWKFFDSAKMVVNPPRFTTNPPQLHHDLPSRCTPRKSQNPRKIALSPARKISRLRPRNPKQRLPNRKRP